MNTSMNIGYDMPAEEWNKLCNILKTWDGLIFTDFGKTETENDFLFTDFKYVSFEYRGFIYKLSYHIMSGMMLTQYEKVKPKERHIAFYTIKEKQRTYPTPVHTVADIVSAMQTMQTFKCTNIPTHGIDFWMNVYLEPEHITRYQKLKTQQANEWQLDVLRRLEHIELICKTKHKHVIRYHGENGKCFDYKLTENKIVGGN